MAQAQYQIEDLLQVMERLRDPNTGCPWDLAQDFHSIVSSTLEECYELVQAIEDEDFDHVAEELGDVLFQVIFYAQMGSEQDKFTFGTIVNTLVEKLVRRHPHVFPKGALEASPEHTRSLEDVSRSWEAIKRSERQGKSQNGVLADIPVALPALSRAQKLQKRARQFNFDWDSVAGVRAKLAEELDELDAAIAAGDGVPIREELGDVLFTCVNLARHLEADAEQSLREASSKFERRVESMEALARSDNRELEQLNEAELDTLWEHAKTLI